MKSIHERIILDKVDSHLLDSFEWCEHGMGYAQTEIQGKKVLLHHLILPKKKGFDVDHINRNKLDNRRSNLRYTTHQQNSFNSSKKKNNTSGFRGVSWCKTRKKWVATIQLNGKSINLGGFMDIEDAAKAYKNEATKLFQEFLGEL